MSIPKEPRQIMINLMYLVLTAMLALNVSSEILHAFKVINASILSSNGNIQNKNEEIYKSLQTQEDQPASHDRVKPYNDKAKQIKAQAAQMMDYLNVWKERIIDRSGGYEIDGDKKDIKAQSDIDAATKLLIEDKGGDTLKQKITDLRNMMLSQLTEADKALLEKTMPLAIVNPEKGEGNPTGDWSIGHFHMIPVMAAVTMLSKFQNDVRNSEAMVLNKLAEETGQDQVKFDNLDAIAVPTQSYVLAGQKVEARIMMVAYNDKVKPEVNSNMGHVTKTDAGIAQWENTAGGVGMQTVSGKVTVDLGNRKVTKDYKFQYMVGSEGGSLQLDKMNVFYIGVDNPVTVSAAGYSLEDVSLQFPDGEVKAGEGKGKFLIRSSKQSGPDGVEVKIMAKTAANGIKQVGGMKVRVKYIPDPVAEVGGQAGGYMSASKFRVQLGVNAALHNFEFDARYVVTEFNYSVIKKRSPDLIGPFKINGPSFNLNKDASKIQLDLKPGDRVFIDDIKARGPDGRNRNLNPLSFILT